MTRRAGVLGTAHDVCQANQPMDLNPYHSTSAATDTDERSSTVVSRRTPLHWLFLYLYPLLVVSAFYGTWLCAWAGLGHAPRPNLDDPRSIGGVTQVLYYIPAILVVGMPALAPLGLVAALFLPRRQKNGRTSAKRCFLALLYVVTCGVALKFLWADPHQVVEWYFD